MKMYFLFMFGKLSFVCNVFAVSFYSKSPKRNKRLEKKKCKTIGFTKEN